MKIETELKYTEEYLPSATHRKMRERDVSEPFSVEIAEISSADSPIVLRTHDIERYSNGNILSIDYRQYNDNLYIPLRVCEMCVPENDEEANMPFPVDELKHYFRSRYGLSREDAMRELLDYADRFLLIDGALWEKANEPMYQVCTFGLGHNHGGTALMITNHFNPNCRWTDYFTSLQHDEAIEAAVAVATRRGDDQSIEGIKNKRYYIEVLDPSAVKADPKSWGGKGDDFLNLLSDLTSSSDSVLESGLLVMAAANSEIRKDIKKSLTDQIQSASQRSDSVTPEIRPNPDLER